METWRGRRSQRADWRPRQKMAVKAFRWWKEVQLEGELLTLHGPWERTGLVAAEARGGWDHRGVVVGRDLWRSASPARGLTQGQLEHVTQECVRSRSGFEFLQGWRPPASLETYSCLPSFLQ